MGGRVAGPRVRPAGLHINTYLVLFSANPWWVDVLLAPVFALLACILLFMDQQITAVIVNRKEYK